MSLQIARDRRLQLKRTLGSEVMASLFPNDFEVYITGLELIDSNEKTVDYFLFPLNPTSISESENQILNIKKTAGGISTLSTEMYMPTMINLVGDFGRKFKILIGRNIIDFKAFNFSQSLGFNQIDNDSKEFNNTIKTGYGCIKVLERIIKKSNRLDQDGKPYFLYLYNLSFGKTYLVKCVGQPTFASSIEKNMIWSYNIQFQTLAEVGQIKGKNEKLSNLKQLGFSKIQTGLNVTLNKIKVYIT